MHSAVAALGRERALRLSFALHAAAFVALLVALRTLAGAGLGTPWGAVTIALAVIVAALLFLEQRWAEDVNLAFFKVNVWVGFAVLAAVLAARMAGGGF